jgi:hypothetical protein
MAIPFSSHTRLPSTRIVSSGINRCQPSRFIEQGWPTKCFGDCFTKGNILSTVFMPSGWSLRKISSALYPVTGKVAFLIAGTQKGGTTALYGYLRKHPQVCMAKAKELHFFDKERFFADGAPDYSTYHRHFRPRSPSLLLGEATPIYMYWQPAARRIWEYNPEMKFIISLRNPILRAFSHWNMERSRAREPLSFWDALQMESERCKHALPLQDRKHSYAARGFYHEQLARLWSYFPKEQTHVLRQEDLDAVPGRVMDEVCAFLGIGRLKSIREQTVFSTPYICSMSRREWHYLAGLFEPDIRALESALKWDCSDWLREPRFRD